MLNFEHERSRPQWLSLLLIPLLLLSQTATVHAEASDTLAFFQEEAKVVTASRREQPISDSPVAIDVITARDIEASGAVNLWDLLRFRMGMDVIDSRSLEGNRAIVSVRGFPQEFSRNVLVLIDGRRAYSDINGGVFWQQLAVQIQDIERIEIVRGPNAALFGTGAALGVINIITEKPEPVASAELGVLGGNRGALQTSEMVGGHAKNFAYRVSHTFREDDGARAANGSEGNDFLNQQKGNFRGIWTLSEKSTLDLSAGGSWMNEGLGPQKTNADFERNFQMLRFHRRNTEASSVEWMASRSEAKDIFKAQFDGPYDDLKSVQYHTEALHSMGRREGRLNTTYGGSVRKSAAKSATLFSSDPKKDDSFLRGFVSQMVAPLPWLTLVGAFSLEKNAGAKTRPAYQLSNLIRASREHAFRASYSVAHTVPPTALTESNVAVLPGVRLVGNPDLKPQRFTSYEAGHSGRYRSGRLQSESNLFYTTIDHVDQSVSSFSPVPVPLITTSFINVNRVIVRGVETGLTYRWNPGDSVFANYTYEHISDEKGNEGQFTRNTPKHKVNLGSIVALGRGFSASANLGYKDGYLMQSVSRRTSVTVPAYWRVDARLAYRPENFSQLQLFVAGQNLSRSNHLEAADGLIVPRTYQAGLTLGFGR